MAEKTLSFELDITGITAEEQEMSKLTLRVKELNKELRDMEKTISKGVASPEQLARHAALTKELDKNKKELQEVKKGLDIGGFGTQWTKLGDTIRDNIKGLVSTGAVLGLVTTAVNKLKEAWLSTTQGMNFFNQAAEVGKQLMYDLVTTGKFMPNFENMERAAKAAKMLNEIRAGDRVDLIEVARLQRTVNELRYEASDQTKTDAERLESLNKTLDAHNKLVDYQIADLKEELAVTVERRRLRKDDEKLKDLEAQQLAKLEDLEAQRVGEMRRVNSVRTGLIEKEKKESKERVDTLVAAYQKDAEEFKKAEIEKAKVRKQVKEDVEALLADQKAENADIVDKIKETINNEVEKYSKIKDIDTNQLLWNKDVQKQNANIVKEGEELWTKLVTDAEERRKAIRQAAWQGAEMGVNAVFNARRQRLQAEMEAELTNTNLTERQKNEIRKKYAREQQKDDTKQALINTALAIGNALATTKPFIPAGIIAGGIAAVQGAIQVAAIKAQKFAQGGRITGGVPVDTGTVDNRLIVANETETVLTARHVAMLGGSAAMRRIQVPGYANGGYVGQSVPEIPSQGFDYQQLARLMNSVEVVLNVNKLNAAQNEVNIINQPSGL